MPRRTKEEAAVTRETLLKAALNIFSRKGFASSTLEDIAREAGVTRGALYWHFQGKAELYNTLMESYASRRVDIVQAAVEEGGGLVDVLRRVFVRMLAAVEQDRSLREVMEINLFKTQWMPELQEGQQQRLMSTRGLLSEISVVLQQGINSGELRRDIGSDDMARAFLGFQNGVIFLWLVDPTAFSLAESAPAMAEIYLQGVLPLQSKKE